jgi:hypothetical protein
VRGASPSSAAAASSGRFFFLAYSSSSLALTLTSCNRPHGCRQTAKSTQANHMPPQRQLSRKKKEIPWGGSYVEADRNVRAPRKSDTDETDHSTLVQHVANVERRHSRE